MHTWHVLGHGGWRKFRLFRHTGLSGAGVQDGAGAAGTFSQGAGAGAGHGAGAEHGTGAGAGQGAGFAQTTGAGVQVGAGVGADGHTSGAGMTNFWAHEHGFFGTTFDLQPQPPTANACFWIGKMRFD